MTIPTHCGSTRGMALRTSATLAVATSHVYTHTADFLFQFNWMGWKTLTGINVLIPAAAEGRDFDGDGQRDIYVAEHESKRVVVFDKAGQFLGAFPSVAD